jgi:hypothetical protein
LHASHLPPVDQSLRNHHPTWTPDIQQAAHTSAEGYHNKTTLLNLSTGAGSWNTSTQPNSQGTGPGCRPARRTQAISTTTISMGLKRFIACILLIAAAAVGSTSADAKAEKRVVDWLLENGGQVSCSQCCESSSKRPGARTRLDSSSMTPVNLHSSNLVDECMPASRPSSQHQS